MDFSHRYRAAWIGGIALACGLLAAAPPARPPAAQSGNQPVKQANAQAQVAPSAEIAATLEPLIKAHDLPGMVAAIVEGDGVGGLEIGCAGVRERGKAEAITIFDRMHLGSCTKSMTATMIATLVQDGKLSYDTTVGEVFAGVPVINDKMDPAWRNITMRLLLTNRSGAPGDLDADGLWKRLCEHQGDATSARMQLVAGVTSRPPAAPPNAKFIYSNAGFSIAGAMAEQVTGESWETLMQERVFEPLAMNSAGFGSPGSAKSVDQPRGHAADGKPMQPGPNADNPVAIGPAGIVHCSVIDWSAYAALHIQGARGKDTAILKADAFDILHTPAKKSEGEAGQDYAMGWGVTRRSWAGDGAVLTHNGSNTMWFATVWIAPGKDFAVLVACNEGGDEAAKACDEAAAAMIKRHAQKMQWP